VPLRIYDISSKEDEIPMILARRKTGFAWVNAGRDVGKSGSCCGGYTIQPPCVGTHEEQDRTNVVESTNGLVP
jgi:hypothetical protein